MFTIDFFKANFLNLFANRKKVLILMQNIHFFLEVIIILLCFKIIFVSSELVLIYKCLQFLFPKWIKILDNIIQKSK